MDGKKVRPHPYRIPLKQEINGFGDSIGSWASPGEPSFIVDEGPKASFEILLEGLKRLGMTSLDFVFLTHIHIDHAGALGP
jgi:glyoxylase-like metal-dependent hydrolase (beta-lactamase superfamily II)